MPHTHLQVLELQYIVGYDKMNAKSVIRSIEQVAKYISKLSCSIHKQIQHQESMMY